MEARNAVTPALPEPAPGNKQQHRRRVAIDMDAHNGLRGVAAVWICLFHCLLFSVVPTNWQGSTLMPLFFILSGFSLTIVYGGKPEVYQYRPAESGSAANGSGLRWWPYFKNRLARVMPAYYFGLALALPLWFYGYGFFPPNAGLPVTLSIILSVIPVGTWVAPISGWLFMPIDAPSWTIMTLLFMWAVFPAFLTGIHRMSDKGLVNAIIACYWAQMLLLFCIYYPLEPFMGYWPAFSTSTMHPLSRLPVFLMGVYAGALCLRYPDPDTADAPMPWPSPWWFFVPGPCTWRANSSAAWAVHADWYAGGLLIFTVLVGAADTGVFLATRGGTIGGGVWLQAVVAGAQLVVVVALTRDGRASRASKALRTPFAVWLGGISMALYLVHLPIIGYLAWAVHGGTNTSPAEPACTGQAGEVGYDACMDALGTWAFNQAIPLWGIVVVTPVAVALAWAVFHLVEEPGRKALRYKGKEEAGGGAAAGAGAAAATAAGTAAAASPVKRAPPAAMVVVGGAPEPLAPLGQAP